MDLNGFYNHAVHILRPKITESGEPELNNIGEKYQDKNELIIYNTITNLIWNQIADMIQGFDPLFQESETMSLLYFNPLPFLE